MKKPHNKLLAVLLTISFAACSAPAVTTTPSIPVAVVPAATMRPPISVTALPAVVTFTDPVLEEMVRGAMGKPKGNITVSEAEAVTRLDLSNELRRYISTETSIKDISGLESFTNLESLDLSFHNITDISPLAKLTKLTSLSLGGSPVADISALGRLTNLKLLILSNCTAQDYSPLAKLVNLEFLMLDHSTITDVLPLVSLTNLKHLYMADSPVIDYYPLLTIYPNLENKDFTIASTLKELGFNIDDGRKQANFDSEDASITINHSEWGAPPADWDRDIIRVSTYLESDYKLAVGFYGDLDAYVFMMDKDGRPPMNYVYDTIRGNFTFGSGDRESSEQEVRAAMNVVEGEDVLLAPIHIFNDTIQKTFKMTADALYAMPFEPPSLKSLGFVLDENTGNFMYEQHEGIYTTILINRAEGIEKEFDVVFFQPISDEYRVNVTYYVANKRFYVKADDNDQGGAIYEYFIDTGEHIDEWCSDPDKTVEDYFINAYNDPGIEDIHLHSVELMMQYIRDTFSLTVEELYTLPTGE